jgi:predicted acyl esterase
VAGPPAEHTDVPGKLAAAPTTDAYWKHGSVCEDYAAIQCPVYAVGGWTDAYKDVNHITGQNDDRK